MNPGPVITLGVAVALGGGLLAWSVSDHAASSPAGPTPPAAEAAGTASGTVRRGTFVKSVRLTGIVEAVDFHSVMAPRLTGGGGNRLTVVRLAPKGTIVAPGDLLVELDRQAQLRQFTDKRAEWRDLEEQIRRKVAEQAAARAQDETSVTVAENAVARARLELVKNDMLPTIEAEKNTLALDAAEARLVGLRNVARLKQRAAAADLQMLEVRRDRAAASMRHAERNAERMIVRAPIAGMVVLKSVWKDGQMGEVQEGEEVWPGTALLDVVGPRAMRVRVKVNQADLEGLRPGLPARVTLDAYPDRSYTARLEQLAPIGATSQFSGRVRTFVALFTIDGHDLHLAPDLSAAVDVEVERLDNVLLAPRAAVAWRDGTRVLKVGRPGGDDVRQVTFGPANDIEVVVQAGADEGLAVRR